MKESEQLIKIVIQFYKTASNSYLLRTMLITGMK